MRYLETFQLLRSKVNYDVDFLAVDHDLELRNYSFVSNNVDILPGERHYNCLLHRYESDDTSAYHYDAGITNSALDIHDSQVRENREFRYHVFSPKGTQKSSDILFLLHGFNEKNWAKYLPWAKQIVEMTGKTVVLFPIAFHMNRAPQLWSDKREMNRISGLRRTRYPDILSSTLSNVAISSRLHTRPQRFFWSGLQTYYDVIQFVEEVKAGKHPIISADSRFDFFAYSIGSLLAQILLMTNYKGYFNQAKLCMFCGGAVFNRLSPVSKFILDSEANVALYSFVIEHLESHLKKDHRLHHYLRENHPEGANFASMINYKLMHEHREQTFSNMSDRILAITLLQDTIIPSYEVMNTLQGIRRDIPVRVEALDFDYNYRHEDPFPAVERIADEVDQAFRNVFDLAGGFYK